MKAMFAVNLEVICFMEKEVFPVIIDGKKYNIISTFPYGCRPDDHQVWNGDELLFIINPKLNEAGDPFWTLVGEYLYKNFDQDFVNKVGEAIEQYYL